MKQISQRDLPHGWSMVRLGELAQVRYGKAIPKEVGRYPAIGSGGEYAKVNQPLVEYPTIVVGRKGSAGRAWLSREPCWPSDTTFYLDWTSDVDVDFVYSALIANPIGGVQGDVLPSLKRPDLEQVQIALPPLMEQHAIAHVLRTVQGAKEATEQVIAAARELKRSLLSQLLDGRWSQRPIGEVCETATGGTPNRKVSEYFGGNIPWVKSGEVVDGRIKYTSEMLTSTGLESCNAQVFPAGTLLIAMYGAGVTAGRVGLLEIDAATNQAVCAILPDQAEADSRFLFHVLIHLRSAVRSARHGSNQPNLSQRIIRGLPVPLPPLDEQYRIAEKTEALDRKVMAEEARRDALVTIFDSLLHDLMTARLRATDLEVSL